MKNSKTHDLRTYTWRIGVLVCSLLLELMILPLNVCAKEDLFEGMGTEADPYRIADANDLLLLAKSVNEEGVTFEDRFFALVNDIDLSGIVFTPIGIYDSGNYFLGTLDGNGYRIKNITINVPGMNNALFGMLGGNVLNLEIDGGMIEGNCCGVFSSHATSGKALVMNCSSRNVTVKGIRAGGIVDNFGGSVINCVSEGCVLEGTDRVGGISSYGIGGDSYGNYYVLDDRTDRAKEVTIAGNEELLDGELNTQDMAERMNQTYRRHDVYKEEHERHEYGSCNIWAINDVNLLEITNVKQQDVFLENIAKLSGTGALEDPYLINNAEELVIFRDAVNSGYDFSGEYIRQNADIDLSEEVWTPIGSYGTDRYFYGTYDGAGHIITNLTTIETGASAFFGVLGGTVVNLGIDSGVIRGSSCGTIASHAASTSAAIINCYARAKVEGRRAGGIADNIGEAAIIGCWSDCELIADVTGGISSYNAQISMCCTSSAGVVPNEHMTGASLNNSAGIKFEAEDLIDIAAGLNENLQTVAEVSGIRVALYPFVVEDGRLVFSDEPYSSTFGEWLDNHYRMVMGCLIALTVLSWLILEVGPKAIYADERSWSKRFLSLLPPVFLFFYMFFIHGPIEFFLINNAEFGFVLGDFAWKYIVVSVGAVLGISALLAFCKGKVCDCLACAVFGIDLCMYIQLNFMNGSLGLLDGTEKTVDMKRNWINLIIWIVLFILPFVAFRFFKKYRDRIVVFICSALTVMQITSLVWLIVVSPEDAFVSSLSQYLLLGDNQFTVSADKNIIILVIDTYSNSYVDEFFETYPEVAEVVKDFTYYNNADCHYEGSVLSLNYLVSGTEWDMSVPIDEWCTTALDNEKTDSFYSRLHDQNYILNLYTGEFGNLSNVAKQSAMGKISNLEKVEADYKIDGNVMFELFVNASAYRYAPMIFKEGLEFTADQYSSACRVLIGGDAHSNVYLNNVGFYQKLMEKGLSTDNSGNYYIIQHLQGLHGPYRLNEQCKTVGEATLLQTERGCWQYIEEYLDQLKRLGVYEEATIVITADHGEHHSYYGAQLVFFIKSPGESHSEYVETNAPISFTDMMPTVLYLTGAEYSDFGKTIFEYGEDEQRERTLYVRMYDEALPKVPKRNSSVDSILNCFYKYVYTGDQEDLNAVGENGPTEKVPWTEFFY